VLLKSAALHSNEMSIAERFWKKVHRTEDCWLWTASFGTHGYGQFQLNGTMRPTHRIAWELTRGPIPAGLCVLHKCDVRPCVNPDHLFLGTKGDNSRDKVQKGRHRFGVCESGERHPRAKLTNNDVLVMRHQYAEGMRICELVRIYGVNRGLISGVVHGHRWTHV